MKIAIKQVRGGSGVDVWVQNLCTGIRDEGHECVVDLYPVCYQFFPALARFTDQDFDGNVVQSNTWNGFAFKKKVPIPLVATEHLVVHDPLYNPYRSLPQKIYHSWVYRCERKTLDVADTVVCVSNYTKNKLEEAFGYTDSRVIYNGIDSTIFEPKESTGKDLDLPKNKTVLFFAGNLSRRKGADLLPGIMKQLGENYILLLATGQKPTFVIEAKNIINIGHLDRENLVNAYNRCDIFLSASRLEGFGLSVAEAMSCAKPVVATNGSSLPELVIDGKGGFLCQMDNVRDFARKITILAEDENLRRTMGTFNRRFVLENFRIERMVKEYIQLYGSLQD